MRPAFSSTKSAAAFAILVAAVLVLPAAFGGKFLPAREQAYASVGWRLGAFPWIHRQIFLETNDVDIAFVGSSVMFSGIDARYVQHALTEKTGRPATVFTLGWFWAGFDATYFVAQDLLQHRRVKMLVLYDEDTRGDHPHPSAPIWFRWADNSAGLTGLPARYRAGLYTSAIMGMPRNFLGRLRADQPVDAAGEKQFWAEEYFGSSPAETLGTIVCRRPFLGGTNFFRFQPTNDLSANDLCLYSPATSGQFRFTGPPLPPYQLFFLKKLAALAEKDGTRLVFLHLRNQSDAGEKFILERANWTALLPGAALVGIAPAKLFAGLSSAEIARFYYGEEHFNENGLDYFTRRISPALLQLYETANDRR